MGNDQLKLYQLLSRLENLAAKQENFSKEINELKVQINELRLSENKQPIEEAPTKEVPIAGQREVTQLRESEIHQKPISTKAPTEEASTELLEEEKPSPIKADLEKFIGENLINKIGIAITIIGVGIGVKYSIDHDLVTPLMRIISGYLIGLAMLGVGIKLKTNYEDYSAVLVSGAMAIMYFITFAAYSFYGLLPLSNAFVLMVIFTSFTVLASLKYNQQVISLIGMVGAYAVPFLLSTESGNIKILLSYISLINIGILVVAFWKYWKLLYYAAFLLSWLILGFWYANDFRVEDHFNLTLVFSAIFFATFYATFLASKLVKKEIFRMDDILLLLLNSFFFYGIGYITFDQHEVGKEFLGLFTVGNALIHLIVSIAIFKQSKSDRNVFFFVVGLALVFITIAIPIQLNGKWVTLLWLGEAILLFWIGRTKEVSVYEKLSYSLILLAFLSLLQDWNQVYGRQITADPHTMFMTIFNIQFLTSLLFSAGLGYIFYLYKDKKHPIPSMSVIISDVVKYALPGILLLTIYFAIHLEISNYWNQLFATSAIEINQGQQEAVKDLKNFDMPSFKTIWLTNYALLFFTLLLILNSIKIKDRQLGIINLVLGGIALYVFLLNSLYVLSELRESYLNQTQADYFEVGIYHLVIRYISFVFVAGLLAVSHQYSNQQFIKKDAKITISIFSHISILWILSSELIHWLDIIGSSSEYKLGLSILWGSYSLLMIVFGIWMQKKHLRVIAILIFAVTLIKLFFYDISHLETIPKTIVFVSLGIFLLIISFLYNKYKIIIADEE